VAELLFYLLSLGALAFGAGVVSARVPLFAVLSLLGSFFCLAGIYLLAGFPFLAATQLLVYGGAIMVLFLFVVMLLDLGNEAEVGTRESQVIGRRGVAIAAGAAGLLAVISLAGAGLGAVSAADGATDAAPGYRAPHTPLDVALDDVQGIAEVLFSRYVLPFEAASLLLLVTMIAVVLLAKRQREGTEAPSTGWPWRKGVQP
jgi:NADH-quinone oxidoreductase subunit J